MILTLHKNNTLIQINLYVSVHASSYLAYVLTMILWG
jgi:hypothetical protein